MVARDGRNVQRADDRGLLRGRDGRAPTPHPPADPPGGVGGRTRRAGQTDGVSRRQHYRDFYQGPPAGERPFAMVHGNCQAEALRVLLAGSASFGWQMVRVPPVHELTEDDLVALDALLARCTLLVTQPVRDGYRGLPLGTREMAERTGATVVRVPIVRYSGLQPWSAIVRVPDGAEPPVVPYHDLRTLTGREPTAVDLVAVAQASVDELARRERRDTDVAVSDLLLGLGADAVHVLNHPGNGLLIGLARRIQEMLNRPADAGDPGRELLGRIRAPLEPAVLDALGLDAPPREHWLVDGEPVAAGEVVAAHRAFYADRPDVAAAGLARHGSRLASLGLA